MSPTMMMMPDILNFLANRPVSPAAEGAALAMLAVIFFLAFSIFAAAMVLRKRARSAPRPENELLDELNAEQRRNANNETKQTKPARGGTENMEEPEWERDADWWKK